MAAADYVSVVQQLYVAYFGRPADVTGLANFTAALDATGVPATIEGVKQAYGTNATVKTLVDQFGTSTESATLYGSGTVESFVFAIYQNVLNRVPDADGFKFWTDEINAGRVARAKAALDIMAGAKANTSAQGLIDAATVDAKISVATNFTTAVTTQNATYAGDAAAEAARDMLATVTNTTDVTAFQSTITSTLTTITNPDAGSTFTLTTATDSLVGTAKNDTFTASSTTLGANDVVVGGEGTDALNVTLTAGNAQATVSGVENVNFAWDAFGTAAIDATKITGATITGTSTKTGFLGHMTVTAAAANKIVAGAGMVGTLTVNGATAANVDAGAAKSVVVAASGVAASDVSANVTAGANTTSVNVGGNGGFKTTTINAGTATAITLADQGTTSTTSLTVGKSATVTNGGTGDLTLNVAAADVVTTLSAVGKSLTITGAQATTLKATAAALTTETVTDSLTAGDLTVAINGAIAADADLSKVQADKYTIDTAFGGAAEVAVAKGSYIKATVDLSTNAELGVLLANDSTSDTLTLETTKNQALIDVDAGTTLGDIETLMIVAAATAVTGTDLTITDIVAGANKVIINGTNDVVVTEAIAKTVDASALVGDFTVTQQAADTAAMTVLGASGVNTVILRATANDSSFTGQNANDTVTFANTTGNATAVLGNGTNSVSAATTTGSLVVIGGDGVDTVTATAVAGAGTGEVNLNLGAGADVVTIATNGASDVVTIDAGAGNDSVTFQTNPSTANDVYTLTFGDGTDTLNISSVDLTAGTWTVSGLETIAIGSSDTAAKVNSTLLSGKTYEITGDGTATDRLAVEMDAAASADFSGIVINQTLTKGLAGLSVTGSTGNDTIIGTSASDVIVGNGGTDSITGGAGADSITVNGSDTVVIATADTGNAVTNAAGTNTADYVDGFTSGSDKLDLDVAGTLANFAAVDGAAATTFAAALTAARAALTGDVKYVYVYGIDSTAGTNLNFAAHGIDSDDGILVYDADGVDGGEDVVVLTGLTLAGDLAYTDII